MTDLELLFLVFVLLYVWECAWWLRSGAVGFRTWLGTTWRPVLPGALLGNQSGGFIFGHAVPPLGKLFVASPLPFLISAEAVLGARGHLWRFEEIRSVQVQGKKVRVNGEAFLKTSSQANARHFAEELQKLARRPPRERESAIKELFRESLDIKTIAERWRYLEEQAGYIYPLANLLFGYLFIFVPLLLWSLGPSPLWPWLLVGLFAGTFAMAYLFRRAHLRIYPESQDERFTESLTIALYPALAVRAHDLLSRPLLERFHPLALAKVFCPEPVFRKFATTVLRELRYPLPWPNSDGGAGAVERSSHSFLLVEIERFLEQKGLRPEELLAPPARADETCLTYCPRCLTQFTEQAGTCADCGGLALHRLIAF